MFKDGYHDTQVGYALTRTAGTWTDPLGGKLTYSGKLVRMNSTTYVETDIRGATGRRYVVTADDLQYRIRYHEIAK